MDPSAKKGQAAGGRKRVQAKGRPASGSSGDAKPRKPATGVKKPATGVKKPAKPGAGSRSKAPATEDGIDADVVKRFLPMLRALRGYTRLKVEGLANVPRKGGALLAANHTGWLGLDYALTAVVLHDDLGRLPRGMVHEAWFLSKATSDFARKVGLSKVSKEAMAEIVEGGHLAMVFPEGEKGAFRPASGYRVEEFARGFVRVAMQTGTPIVPVAILGGEESNPVDRTIESYEKLLHMRIPVPANLWPKPVKWRLRFLPARDMTGYGPADAADADLVHAISQGVRADIQEALVDMKRLRGHPYI